MGSGFRGSHFFFFHFSYVPEIDPKFELLRRHEKNEEKQRRQKCSVNTYSTTNASLHIISVMTVTSESETIDTKMAGRTEKSKENPILRFAVDFTAGGVSGNSEIFGLKVWHENH